MVVPTLPAVMLFAEARPSFDFEFMALIVGLFLLIAIGVVVTLKLRAQAKSVDSPVLPTQNLAHYQKLLDDGLIDAHEYRQIVATLGQQPRTPPAKS